MVDIRTIYYTFTGQYSYMDDLSTPATEGFGLMFYNARFYDPALGRFTSADTIVPNTRNINMIVGYSENQILHRLNIHNAEELVEHSSGGKQNMDDVPLNSQALDRYAYANNNPVMYSDPSGHDAVGFFSFDGWGYIHSLLGNELKTVRDKRDNAMTFGGLIGAAFGGAAGVLCTAGALVCGAFGAVAGAVIGGAVGYQLGGGESVSQLEEAMLAIDEYVNKLKMSGNEDGFEILFDEGISDNGYYLYRIQIDGKWRYVNGKVYRTLLEAFSNPESSKTNDSQVEDDVHFMNGLAD